MTGINLTPVILPIVNNIKNVHSSPTITIATMPIRCFLTVSFMLSPCVKGVERKKVSGGSPNNNSVFRSQTDLGLELWTDHLDGEPPVPNDFFYLIWRTQWFCWR